MCEMLIVGAEEPVPFTRLEPWVLAQEYYGIAGWGWGVAHMTPEDTLDVRRSVGRLCENPAALEELRGCSSRRWSVLLRRPLSLPNVVEDTQPFYSERLGFAYTHNGDFTYANDFRGEFGTLLAGKADSEVGFRMTEKLLAEGCDIPSALDGTLERLGGTANVALMLANGAVWIDGRALFNKLWRFRVGAMTCAATSMLFRDESFFDVVFEGEPTERARVNETTYFLPPIVDANARRRSKSG